jgi:hypothetical protein
MSDRELTIGERWEQGIDHDPRSEEIVRAMSRLYLELCEGCLDIRVGGDGDNGETMMYLLDIYFERKDAAR